MAHGVGGTSTAARPAAPARREHPVSGARHRGLLGRRAPARPDGRPADLARRARGIRLQRDADGGLRHRRARRVPARARADGLRHCWSLRGHRVLLLAVPVRALHASRDRVELLDPAVLVGAPPDHRDGPLVVRVPDRPVHRGAGLLLRLSRRFPRDLARRDRRADACLPHARRALAGLPRPRSRRHPWRRGRRALRQRLHEQLARRRHALQRGNAAVQRQGRQLSRQPRQQSAVRLDLGRLGSKRKGALPWCDCDRAGARRLVATAVPTPPALRAGAALRAGSVPGALRLFLRRAPGSAAVLPGPPRGCPRGHDGAARARGAWRLWHREIVAALVTRLVYRRCGRPRWRCC